jgi:serine/threonine protein kinase
MEVKNPKEEVIIDGYRYSLTKKKTYKCLNCSSSFTNSSDSKSGHSSICRNLKSKSLKQSDQSNTPNKIYLLNNEVNEINCETIDDYRIYLTDSFKIKNIDKQYFTIKKNKDTYFVKNIKKDKNFFFTQIMDEINIGSSLNHPNLIKYLTFFEEVNNIFIVSKLFGKNLSIYCEEKKYALETVEIIFIFKQICQGLLHIHDKGIIHRDIKPSNILINNDKIKITDYGLSTRINKFKAIVGNCGTKYYKAPEINDKYTIKSDIWSLGCTLLYMCKGHMVHNELFLKNPMYFVDSLPKPIEMLVKKLMSNIPEERPPCSDIISMIDNMELTK